MDQAIVIFVVMRSRAFLYCAVIIALFLKSITCFGQRIPFYNLSIEQGLIQSQATTLAQDNYGHLWIGTLGGLSRWNGRAFTNYSIRDGLPSNTIYALAVAPDNMLCIGTTRGLSVYDGYKFRNYIFSSPDNPQGNLVNAIQVINKTIWCMAGGKLYSLENGKVKALITPGNAERVSAILADKTGRLWVSGFRATAVYQYYNGQWDSATFADKQKIPFVYRLYQDKDQKLWALSTRGIYRIIDNTCSPVLGINRKLIGHPIPLSMAQAYDGSYWLGTASGALRIRDTSVTYLNRSNGLTDNRVFYSLTDKEGNVWLATDGQGIFRYSGAPFTILDEASGLPSNQINSFASDGEGRLYMSTYEAGVFYYQNGKVTQTSFPKNIPVAALANSYGAIWAGTRGAGLYTQKAGQWKRFEQLPFNTITMLVTDNLGRLWIGASDGVAVYNGDSIHVVSRKEGFVSDILNVSADSTLVAGDNGLAWYIDDTRVLFTTGTAIDSASTQCMAKAGNTIFFGTSDNGILSYDLSTHKGQAINRSNGLRSDFIYNLIFDNNGDLWAGTGYGIHRIHFTDDGYSIAFYGQEAGLKGMESNHNAVLKLDDGSIWFGTTGGALHYQHGADETKTSPKSIVLQSLSLFGQPIRDSSYFKGLSPYYEVPQNVRLPYRENNLTFTFSGISLGNGAALQYRYKLEGLDEKWSAWSNINTVNYSALPPGKYRLAVQCKGEEDDKIVSLDYPFEIITPFHKTAAFRLLVLAGCILLGVSLQYYAARRRIAREKMIEALRREEQAKVRQRTAEDFHDEVGNKITRINVLASVLRSKLGNPTQDITRIIDSIQDNTGQLYQGTRDILWSLKPSNDSLYEIINRVVHFGQDLFGDTPVEFSYSGLDESWKGYRLPMDASRNLIMIFKEALNNVLKHSGACRVNLTATMDAGVLTLSLHDNGKGFDVETLQRGHGLDNMQSRAKRLNGTLKICSNEGEGTTLTLTAKIPSIK